MKTDNPFDRRLEAQMKMPESIRTAAIHLTDTLDLAWSAVQAVFEKHAKPEHALALLPMFIARADAERQAQLDEGTTRMEAAVAQRSAKKAVPKTDS